MSTALPAPSVAGILTQWSVQPLAVVLVAAAAGWYLVTARRVPDWPVARTLSFLGGLLLVAWGTNGFCQAYGRALFWVWTTQVLFLLLVVPIIVMAGQPVELARRRRGEHARLVGLTRSRFGRFFANPLVGPGLVPLLSAVLFFGPLPGWAIEYDALGWALQVVLVLAGALIVSPLVTLDDDRSSMAVGFALGIGVFELALDAVPGIVLRLNAHLSSTFFDHRAVHAWAQTPLHDQQIAGAILWSVSELIDLPFLVLIYRVWLRADARDAARIDTVLDAERIARGEDVDLTQGQADAPWWMDDPTMRDRLGRN
jgi:cytochrome c oxidase assembly factor CtaG